MVNRQNIQVLFDELTLAGIDAFMKSCGWQIGEHEREDVRVFEFQEEDGHVRRVWIWKSADKPRFRSRIQNLVFTMAVTEGREPIDIANEIYDSRPSAKAETGTPTDGEKPSRPQTLVIRNQFPRDLPISIPGRWQSPHAMPPGTAWHLVLDPDMPTPAMALTPDGVVIESDNPARLRLVEEIPKTARSKSIARLVEQVLAERNPEGSEWADSAPLSQAVSRAGFELDDLSPENGLPPFARKAIATLLSTFADELSDSTESAALLWELCRALSGRLGGRIETYPGGHSELWQVARQDDNVAPVHTLEWVNIRVWSDAD